MKIWSRKMALSRIGNSHAPITRNSAYLFLQECEISKDLQCGRGVQSLMAQSGLDSIPVLGDHLIRLFEYRGSLIEANQTFHKVGTPSTFTWSGVILANAKLGESVISLNLYYKMQMSGMKNDKYVYVAALKACTTAKALLQGRVIHDHIIKNDLQHDVIVGSTLIHMYCKCGSLDEAQKVFETLQDRDLVLWSALITGYAQRGNGQMALEIFEKMQQESILPDGITFLSVLKACANLGEIEQGRIIHQQVIQSGIQLDAMIQNALIDMYAKSGALEEAQNVFENMTKRDIISWSAIIAGFAQRGECSLALELFEKMQVEGIKPNVISWGGMITGYAQHNENILALQCFEKMQENGIEPDEITFTSILKAYAALEALESGRVMHEQIMSSSFQSDLGVSNALVDMYCKCGSLDEGCKVFNELSYQNVVSWNALIEGYANDGECTVALIYFEKMQHGGLKPNEITFLSTLKACTYVGAVCQGRFIHEMIIENGLQSDVSLRSTLVIMYAKSGNLEEAHGIFEELHDRSVVPWNAMITGYAYHGEGLLALECFNRMLQCGISPNEVSFTSALIACSRVGLVEEGQWYLNSMFVYHEIEPSLSHSACMVDLLGRAGYFMQAEELLTDFKQTDSMGWLSLLNACRVHGNVDLGRRCFNQIAVLDSHCLAAYVLMSNIYADVYMQKDACKIKTMARSFRWMEEAWEHIDCAELQGA